MALESLNPFTCPVCTIFGSPTPLVYYLKVGPWDILPGGDYNYLLAVGTKAVYQDMTASCQWKTTLIPNAHGPGKDFVIVIGVTSTHFTVQIGYLPFADGDFTGYEVPFPGTCVGTWPATLYYYGDPDNTPPDPVYLSSSPDFVTHSSLGTGIALSSSPPPPPPSDDLGVGIALASDQIIPGLTELAVGIALVSEQPTPEPPTHLGIGCALASAPRPYDSDTLSIGVAFASTAFIGTNATLSVGQAFST